MLDTCKVVKKAKKGSHDVLGKHVTKLSTYSKLQYIPIEKRYRKVEICKIRRKSIERFVSNTKKVYRVNCGCYCQKRRQKKNHVDSFVTNCILHPELVGAPNTAETLDLLIRCAIDTWERLGEDLLNRLIDTMVHT